MVSWKTKIVKSKQQFPVSKKTTCVFWPFSNPCVNYKGTRRLCTQDHWESEVFRRKHQQCVFVVFSVNELTYFLDWTRSQSILQNFSKNENGIFFVSFSSVLAPNRLSGQTRTNLTDIFILLQNPWTVFESPAETLTYFLCLWPLTRFSGGKDFSVWDNYTVHWRIQHHVRLHQRSGELQQINTYILYHNPDTSRIGELNSITFFFLHISYVRFILFHVIVFCSNIR